jgi:hypothetical protein
MGDLLSSISPKRRDDEVISLLMEIKDKLDLMAEGKGLCERVLAKGYAISRPVAALSEGMVSLKVDEDYNLYAFRDSLHLLTLTSNSPPQRLLPLLKALERYDLAKREARGYSWSFSL